jgi:hypothetical protein
LGLPTDTGKSVAGSKAMYKYYLNKDGEIKEAKS